MRRFVAITVGSVLFVGSASAALAADQRGRADGGREHPWIVRLIDTDQKVSPHDLNANGRLDFGDSVAFRTIDTWHGRTVGHGIGEVTLLGPDDNLVVATLVLRRGSLNIQGDFPSLATGTRGEFGVTGGTGRYAEVSGVAFARQIGNGRTQFRIRLTR